MNNYESNEIIKSEVVFKHNIKTKEEIAELSTKNRQRLYNRCEELKNKWMNSIQVYEKAREYEIISYKKLNKNPPDI